MKEELKIADDLSSKSEGGKASKVDSKKKGSRSKFRKPKLDKASFHSGNDYSYWNKFGALIANAAKIPWNYIPGTEQVEDQITLAPTNVLVVNYIPTFGVNIAATDPFNTWARALWLELHRKYRGLGAYEWSDLAIVIACILDVFGRASEAEFIYGIFHSYPVSNRVNPEGVLKAMGFTQPFVDSVKTNLADFLFNLNRIITKLTQCCLPKGMSYLKNRIGLNAFLYADSKDVRAGYIKFVQRYRISYNATNPQGSCGVYNFRDFTSYSSYSGYLTELESDVDLLLSDTDVARVCSDLLAALGDSGVDKLGLCPVDYKSMPVYEESIMHKLHNAEFIGSNKQLLTPAYSTAEDTWMGTTRNCVISQSGGIIKFEPYVGTSSALRRETVAGTKFTPGETTAANFPEVIPGEGRLLDSWKQDPSDDTVVEGCLWKYGFTAIRFNDIQSSSSRYLIVRLDNCATEILIDYTAYKVSFGSALPMASFQSVTSYVPMAMAIAALSKFDWHPIVIYASINAPSVSGTTGIVSFSFAVPMTDVVFADYDNVTTVTISTVKRVQEAALLSSFLFDGQTFGKSE